MSDRKGVALIGLGRVGMIHIKNILTSYELSLLYVLDTDVYITQTRVDLFGSNLPIRVLDISNSEIAFTDTKVAAIFICSPTDTHVEFIQLAIKNKKHVFCEKPISCCPREIAELYRKAREAEVILFCAFNRRFDPALKEIYNIVSKEGLGKILSIQTCSRDHPTPPDNYLLTSTGIFHDSAIHDIDLVCWMLGERPCSVYVAASAYSKVCVENKDVDIAQIILKFASDSLACIEVGRYSSYGYDQRVEVFGVKGMMASQNRLQNGAVYYDGKGVRKSPLYPTFQDRYRESYENAMKHFIKMIRGNLVDDDSVKAEDAVHAAIIANSCKQSLLSGLPVMIPPTISDYNDFMLKMNKCPVSLEEANSCEESLGKDTPFEMQQSISDTNEFKESSEVEMQQGISAPNDYKALSEGMSLGMSKDDPDTNDSNEPSSVGKKRNSSVMDIQDNIHELRSEWHRGKNDANSEIGLEEDVIDPIDVSAPALGMTGPQGQQLIEINQDGQTERYPILFYNWLRRKRAFIGLFLDQITVSRHNVPAGTIDFTFHGQFDTMGLVNHALMLYREKFVPFR